MPAVPIGFLQEPVHTNMCCDKHTGPNNHCAVHLAIGDVVFVDGSEATFHRGQWMLAVRKLDLFGRRGCKVGFVKCLCDQLYLVCNRVGRITKFQLQCSKDEIATLSCQGELTKEKMKKDNVKRDRKPKDVKPPSRAGQLVTCATFVEMMERAIDKEWDGCSTVDTISVVSTLRGVAWMTFLDGDTPHNHDVQTDDEFAQPKFGELQRERFA